MRNEKEFFSAVTERMSVIRKKKRDRIRVATGVVSVFVVALTVGLFYPWRSLPEGITTGGVIDNEYDGAKDVFDTYGDEVLSPEAVTPDMEVNGETPESDDKDSRPGNPVPPSSPASGATVLYADGFEKSVKSSFVVKLYSIVEDVYKSGDETGVFTEGEYTLLFTVDFGSTRYDFFSNNTVRKNDGEWRIIGDTDMTDIASVIENTAAE